MVIVNLQYKKRDVLSKNMTVYLKLIRIVKKDGIKMSYEIIFNDMIDSLTMAEIKIYEYNIIKEKQDN